VQIKSWIAGLIEEEFALFFLVFPDFFRALYLRLSSKKS